MPTQFTITNTGDFRRFAALAKRVAGSGGLKRESTDAMAVASRGLAREVASSALRILPRRGGLAGRVAKSRYSVRRRTFGRNPTVTFEATNDYNIVAIDDGRVRHPVFGNRRVWVGQVVTQGWFSRPTERQEPRVRRGLVGAMEAIKRRFDRL